jgi:hypothetical protein
MVLTLVSLAIFGLGYWSAYVRIAQSGGEAVDVATKVFLGVMGTLFTYLVCVLITSPGLGVLIAEFFLLCIGQCLGLIFSGKKKNG